MVGGWIRRRLRDGGREKALVVVARRLDLHPRMVDCRSMAFLDDLQFADKKYSTRITGGNTKPQ
jgi:hypothetical protein